MGNIGGRGMKLSKETKEWMIIVTVIILSYTLGFLSGLRV